MASLCVTVGLLGGVFSFFRLSLVFVIFEGGTDLYWSRSRVLEYLNGIRQHLPAGVEPMLGPEGRSVLRSIGAGRTRRRGNVEASVIAGACNRLRPKAMTVTTIMAGLMPILWGHPT